MEKVKKPYKRKKKYHEYTVVVFRNKFHIREYGSRRTKAEKDALSDGLHSDWETDRGYDPDE